LAAALAVPAWTWPSPTGWLWLLAIGLSAAVGQFTMTLAYGAADTALVMPFDFLRLPITALIAFVAFAEVPDLWTWIGAVVIFGSSVYVVRRGR
jgi:drug/metabolite transporter (DMT)-like permease